jgi:magnesium-transporting ATPase (P-type)
MMYLNLTVCRFRAPNIELGEDNIENSENTVLFLTSSFQYILASIVLSVGRPFRKSMRTNGNLLILLPYNLLTFDSAFSYRHSRRLDVFRLHALQAIDMDKAGHAIDLFV